MKIKLVYPPSSHSNEPEFNYLYPLSIATLAGFLTEHGISVEQEDLLVKTFYKNKNAKMLANKISLEIFKDHIKVIDYLNDKFSTHYFDSVVEKLLKQADWKDFELVGFSLFGKENLFPSLAMAKKLKEKCGTKIVLGGPLINKINKEILSDFDFIDYIIKGEGEVPLLQLIEMLEKNKSYEEKIPGLIYKKDNRVLINDLFKESCIDKNPTPVFSKEILEIYQSLSAEKFGERKLILPYEFSKGCTNKCLFCSVCSNIKNKSIKNAISDISLLSERHKIKNFLFVDNAINQSNERLKEFCSELKSHGLNIKWCAQAKPINLDESLLNQMHDSGCFSLGYGIESGSQQVLNRMGKSFNINEAEKVLKKAYDSGILNTITLIVGYINETSEEFNESIDFINRNAKYIFCANAHNFSLYNPSLLYDNPGKYGIEIIKSTNLLSSIGEIKFNELNGLMWDKKKEQQMERFTMMTNKLKDYGLSFDFLQMIASEVL
jgi:radical SAM superfamily enzyme YgiQ (UPF0313 family)